uniref:Uncharacterized protein n=1 Tax=Nothobranchius korthausae TaxID=1143690 RepID=A0A1A8FZE3_9TELE
MAEMRVEFLDPIREAIPVTSKQEPSAARYCSSTSCSRKLLLGPSHETRSSRGAAVTDRARSHTSDFVSKHNNKQEKITTWLQNVCVLCSVRFIIANTDLKNKGDR